MNVSDVSILYLTSSLAQFYSSLDHHSNRTYVQGGQTLNWVPV